ncbi:hypothetical protein H4I95_09508 [Botrytis cinerea]
MLATERKLWWPSSIISAPADRETSQVDGNNDRDSNNRTVLIRESDSYITVRAKAEYCRLIASKHLFRQPPPYPIWILKSNIT